ncbi:MAG: zf-TFIIB domain-containing protein [Deltaproteobacteria bacterium]|nr:zf-TFIIB domain-containing protein [Deltaproteobacteria bacterium]
MDCPRCAVEMVQLEGEGSVMSRCPECAGVWLDIAEVNRLLLRHNMPGLESLGGYPNVDESVGQCPECQVDLVAVEGGERRSMRYDTCEVCGGIFLETETESEDVKEAIKSIIDFYRRFHHAKGAAKGA